MCNDLIVVTNMFTNLNENVFGSVCDQINRKSRKHKHESRKDETCLQFKIKKHYIKTWKISQKKQYNETLVETQIYTILNTHYNVIRVALIYTHRTNDCRYWFDCISLWNAKTPSVWCTFPQTMQPTPWLGIIKLR